MISSNVVSSYVMSFIKMKKYFSFYLPIAITIRNYKSLFLCNSLTRRVVLLKNEMTMFVAMLCKKVRKSRAISKQQLYRGNREERRKKGNFARLLLTILQQFQCGLNSFLFLFSCSSVYTFFLLCNDHQEWMWKNVRWLI
jgi:hypothetical protein